jgi:hypothetical protein
VYTGYVQYLVRFTAMGCELYIVKGVGAGTRGTFPTLKCVSGGGFPTVSLCKQFNLSIFYCLNNDNMFRHKFFNLVLSSPFVYADHGTIPTDVFIRMCHKFMFRLFISTIILKSMFH